MNAKAKHPHISQINTLCFIKSQRKTFRGQLGLEALGWGLGVQGLHRVQWPLSMISLTLRKWSYQDSQHKQSEWRTVLKNHRNVQQSVTCSFSTLHIKCSKDINFHHHRPEWMTRWKFSYCPHKSVMMVRNFYCKVNILYENECFYLRYSSVLFWARII